MNGEGKIQAAPFLPNKTAAEDSPVPHGTLDKTYSQLSHLRSVIATRAYRMPALGLGRSDKDYVSAISWPVIRAKPHTLTKAVSRNRPRRQTLGSRCR